MTTGLIGEHEEELQAPPQASAAVLQDAAQALAYFADTRERAFEPADRIALGFRLNAAQCDTVRVQCGGAVHEVVLSAGHRTSISDFYTADEMVLVVELGETFACRSPRDDGAGHHHAHDGDIIAPMPGKVIAVDVAEGDAVTAGQRLMVLEAMKMEHALTAPFDGVVAELAASAGAQVQVEALLAVIEPAEADG